MDYIRESEVAVSDSITANVQCPQPLDATHLAQLNAALQSIHATQLLIQKCKACQIPVEQAEMDNASQKAVVEAIKAQFFPHSP
jgi:hypothetical protein